MKDVSSSGFRTSKRRIGSKAAAVALSAALLAVAVGCADSDEADVADNTEETVSGANAAELLGPSNPASGEPVTVGMISDGSTDAYDNTDELRAGEATADYFNEHHAGLGGRPVEVVTCETGGTPDGGIDCANQMIQAGAVGVVISQSVATESIWETLRSEGIVSWVPQAFSDKVDDDPEYGFTVFNSRAAFFGLPVSVAETVDSKKLSFVIIDIPQALDVMEGAGEQLLKDAGYEYEIVRVPIGTADMTTQMQQVVDSGAGVVQVVGNDAFCIAAFQGLAAVGYEGKITSVNQCITNATREAMPDGLEGINILANVALGADDDPTWQLYEAVMAQFGADVEDPSNFIPVGGYSAMASFLTSLQDIGTEITAQAVAEAIRAMPQAEYPAGGGVTYQCTGDVYPGKPGICTNQWLRTTLDAKGEATDYTLVDSSDLFS